MGGHWRTFLESDVVRYVDLDGRDFTVQIAKVVKGKVTGAGGKSTGKAMIWLTGWPKPIGAGSALLGQIAAHLGNDTRTWPGKWLKIWPDPSVKYGGEKVGGIRVRTTLPSADEIAKAEAAIAKKQPAQGSAEQVQDGAA
jgi:hypothetical protein